MNFPRPRLFLFTLSSSALLLVSATPYGAQAATPDMLVSSRFSDQILRYDGASGAFVEVFASGGGLSNPVGLTFGPDGHLYVSSANNNRVLRYDGSTGGFLGIFAQGGRLNSPRQLNFGPDGQLYVANAGTNEILRFESSSGAFVDVFAKGGQLFGPTSFSFAPDGDLYVVSVNTDRLKRYDGTTGAFLGTLAPSVVNAPHDLGFGPDGMLYVTSALESVVRRFDPATGVLLGTYVSDPGLLFALGLQWDGAGHFYVVNQGANEVRRYDDESGALESVIIAPASGGLDSPLFMTFFPAPAGPTVEPAVPSRAGELNHMRFAGFEPGRKLVAFLGTPMPSMQLLPCGLEVGLSSGMLLQTLSLDESGAGVMSGQIPLSLAGVTLHVQAFAIRSCESSQVRAVTF